jgi:hypothetical protein
MNDFFVIAFAAVIVAMLLAAFGMAFFAAVCYFASIFAYLVFLFVLIILAIPGLILLPFKTVSEIREGYRNPHKYI